MGGLGRRSQQMACSRRVSLPPRPSPPEHGLNEYLCSRFPVISGFKVTYDSRKEPGNRVTGVWMIRENEDADAVFLEPVKKEKGGKLYTLVTREYMADGHDGFLPLKSCHRVIDEECGSLMSSIVRKYFLGQCFSLRGLLDSHPNFPGSQFVNKMVRLQTDAATFHPKTQAAIEQQRHEDGSKSKSLWKNAVNKVIKQQHGQDHYRNQLNVAANQHMSTVDAFDGVKARQGKSTTYVEPSEDGQDLLVVSPMIDGRFRDEGRDQ